MGSAGGVCVGVCRPTVAVMLPPVRVGEAVTLLSTVGVGVAVPMLSGVAVRLGLFDGAAIVAVGVGTSTLTGR